SVRTSRPCGSRGIAQWPSSHRHNEFLHRKETSCSPTRRRKTGCWSCVVWLQALHTFEGPRGSGLRRRVGQRAESPPGRGGPTMSSRCGAPHGQTEAPCAALHYSSAGPTSIREEPPAAPTRTGQADIEKSRADFLQSTRRDSLIRLEQSSRIDSRGSAGAVQPDFELLDERPRFRMRTKYVHSRGRIRILQLQPLTPVGKQHALKPGELRL